MMILLMFKCTLLILIQKKTILKDNMNGNITNSDINSDKENREN